ncbi:MAG: HD domain-containing protein, partial [candidate division WOR-3 bacterium]
MTEEQLSSYDLVILGALLHDIGKFSQRAGIRCTAYEHFGEDDYGKHGAHSKWSAHFIEEYLPNDYHKTASLVLYHHSPTPKKDELTKIIETADRLSASERIQIEIGDPQKTRLLPILARIFRADWKEKGFQLNPLNINDNIMPQKPAIGDDLTNEYRELWNLFTNEVNELKNKKLTFNAYFTTLYYLLQKYTWCIPSAVYSSEPDISLFDHLKTTAAIAAVIFKSKSNEKFRLI